MSKPRKVSYSDVGVFANGYLLSRVQSFSWELDQGEEEARELANDQVVEYTAQNPVVSISIETNEYGSCRNLRALAQITGGTGLITVDSFDGTTADIGVQIAPDGVLDRTGIMNDATVGSIAWSFDVTGPATEGFSLESDKLTFFKGASSADSYKRAFSLMGNQDTAELAGGVGSVIIPLEETDDTKYMPYRQYIGGILVTGVPTFDEWVTPTGWRVEWTDAGFTAVGTRYRTVIIRTGDTSEDTTITQNTSASANTIGSIPRGKLNIYLTTGAGDVDDLTTTNILRVQNVGIDVDFNREALFQLGFYAAYDRSLTKPVPVSISMSVNDSDLEEWTKLCDKAHSETVTTLDIVDFVKDAKLKIEIYDKVNTDPTRLILKSIMVSGLQVTAISESIDAGSIGTMDYSLKGSNFRVSGVGTPGFWPLSDAPET